MGELVRVVAGHVVFGDAVARVAESLNPLGTLGKAYAETCALAAEVQRLRTEGRRIEAETLATLAKLDDRRHAIDGMLAELRSTARWGDQSAADLRRILRKAERAAYRPGVPLDERRLLLDALSQASRDVIMHHAGARKDLTATIDQVLNGAGAPRFDAPRGNSRTSGRRKGGRSG